MTFQTIGPSVVRPKRGVKMSAEEAVASVVEDSDSKDLEERFEKGNCS